MAKTRFIVSTALVLIASGVCASYAAEKDIVRAQDRVEIEWLMRDYIRTLDSGNAEAYAALFALDGQFGRGALHPLKNGRHLRK
jgi:hypothetical protein